MSATESTAVIPAAPVAAPVAPPAPPAVTVEHISALHRHLDELKSWVGEKFKEIIALVEKAAPAIAPVIAAVEEVAKIVGCCGHDVAAHTQNDGCTVEGCKCSLTAAGARSAGAAD